MIVSPQQATPDSFRNSSYIALHEDSSSFEMPCVMNVNSMLITLSQGVAAGAESGSLLYGRMECHDASTGCFQYEVKRQFECVRSVAVPRNQSSFHFFYYSDRISMPGSGRRPADHETIKMSESA
jgi:hypothetical protein